MIGAVVEGAVGSYCVYWKVFSWILLQ
jgi:hypothetical protein